MALLRGPTHELHLKQQPTFRLPFCFFTAGITDYTTDNRGDVGSWIREACIIGVEKVISVLVSLDFQSAVSPPFVSASLGFLATSALLKQLAVCPSEMSGY